jgi:hypothetical protein
LERRRYEDIEFNHLIGSNLHSMILKIVSIGEKLMVIKAGLVIGGLLFMEIYGPLLCNLTFVGRGKENREEFGTGNDEKDGTGNDEKDGIKFDYLLKCFS